MELRTWIALCTLGLLAVVAVGLVTVVVMGHVYLMQMVFDHVGSDRDTFEAWQVRMIQVAMVFFWVQLGVQLFLGASWLLRRSRRGSGDASATSSG